MDQGPLVKEEIDAGAELVREFGKYEPIQAAFWLRADDEDPWYLYLASDRIDDANLKAAYGEILRLADAMSSPYLDPFRVKLIGASDPLARAATDIQARFPGRLATRFGGRPFGDRNVVGVYLYPSPAPATAT